MKKILLGLFCILCQPFAMQNSLAMQMMCPDEVKVYKKKSDPTKTVIHVQNNQVALLDKRSFYMMPKNFYLYKLLKKVVRRDPKTIIIADIETDIELGTYPPFSGEYRLKLSPQLEKDLQKKGKQDNVAAYIQNFRTRALESFLIFVEFIGEVHNNEKIKMNENRVIAESPLNHSTITVGEYVENLRALECYVQDHNELKNRFIIIKNLIIDHLLKDSQGHETLYAFLFLKSKLGSLRSSYLSLILKMDSFISELSIEEALRQSNCVVMINRKKLSSEALKNNYFNTNFKGIIGTSVAPALDVRTQKFMNEMKNKRAGGNMALIKKMDLDAEKVESKALSHVADYIRGPMLCIACLKLPNKDKKFMTCGRCKEAHYCSQECQQNDWDLHKHTCKKLFECNTCCATTLVSKQFKVCARCKEIHYCSQECQKTDWQNHKNSCIPRNEKI